MPYPNESALRLEDPSKYQKYRRTKGGVIYGDLKVPKTISIIWGHKKGEPKDVYHPQALRFPISYWTESKAKEWIDKHIKNYISFDPASNKQNFNQDMLDLPIYKITPTLTDYLGIAVVEDPAIEEYFMAFSNEVEFNFSYDDDEQIIKGAVMIPDKLIPRNNPVPCYVTYDKESIKLASQYFFKNKCKFNIEHTKQNIEVDILESYFVSEDNKFKNLPIGSWVVSGRVADKKLFQKFKNEKLGFSFQGNFEMKSVENFTKNNLKTNNKMNEFKEKMLNVLNTYLFNEEAQVEEVAPVVEEVVETEQEFAEQTISGDTQQSVSGDTQQTISGDTKYVTPEQLSEALQVIVEQIAELSSRLDEMNTQVQDFGKQPLSIPVTEEVTNNSMLTTKSPYGKF